MFKKYLVLINYLITKTTASHLNTNEPLDSFIKENIDGFVIIFLLLEGIFTIVMLFTLINYTTLIVTNQRIWWLYYMRCNWILIFVTIICIVGEYFHTRFQQFEDSCTWCRALLCSLSQNRLCGWWLVSTYMTPFKTDTVGYFLRGQTRQEVIASFFMIVMARGQIVARGQVFIVGSAGLL